MSRRQTARTVAEPRVGTKAARDFFESWKEINSFFDWLTHMVVHIDRSSQVAHEVLVETAATDDERQSLLDQWKSRVSPFEQLKRQRQFLIEVILVRHVENYLNYLSGLLYEIFTGRPETLRSSDRIELERVLRHSTIESLVRDVADRKVEDLSYSSFADLSEFFAERFKLTVADGADLATLVEMIEIRNLSVHNRGRVNKRFISRTGAPETDLGKKKILGIEHLNQLVPLLAKCVRSLDSGARSRLRIRGSRFGPLKPPRVRRNDR